MCKACVDAFFDADYTSKINAGVAELADAPDSKSGSERSVGSTPTARTNPMHGGRAGMERLQKPNPSASTS